MKKYIYLTLATSLAGCSSTPPVELDHSSGREIASYTFGHQAGEMVANGLAEQRLDKDLFLLGLKDSLDALPPRHSLTDQEVQALHQQYSDSVSEAKRKAAILAGEQNALAEAAFLDSYSHNLDVKKLDSGVLYTILQSGTGEKAPSFTDTLEVHYEGRLPDGTIFDSSFKRGAPVEISLDRVIAGWQHAILEMRKGDRWEIVIPSSLAYGESGRAPAIGPNQLLIFEIELIDIK
ncbi:FKBP-type peptidyl-prolyl cis-trans isomerase [Alcanivorax quisquiliarum]|uniref:Peptidyl-prolyl cis-trans isomerase n=1 Tax=Alcanivorax quisquiliarum TaxID=2933565 RepID=A0ABT0EAB7_9GAMM|nr:FKBP-type peptidyl-prolyl cis-trans isomerase [Alcanivorax quisquiliarum]MCK0538572.1 FKBP-type peptidyl-prolyl cis-trans isomerase [Alcanivorax quisquiliarum]